MQKTSPQPANTTTPSHNSSVVTASAAAFDDPAADKRGTATINVRLPQALKTGGEEVLCRAGLSVTTAIRNLYEYLEHQQTVPLCVLNPKEDASAELIASQRALLKDLIGAARTVPTSAALTLENIRDERLGHKLESGIR